MLPTTAGRGLPALLALTIVVGGAAAADAAILNSLRSFSGAQSGLSGAFDGSYEATGGNSEETKLSAAATVQWRATRDTWRLLGSSVRKTSGGAETERALLAHLRHNHALGGAWSTLAFGQLQDNPFQQLKLRTLVGAGLRWDGIRGERAKLSLGASHMWEREELEGREGETETTRLSAFVSVVAEPRDGLTFDLSAFWQPRWSDTGDWRALVQAEMAVRVVAPLELFTGWNLQHDEQPAPGVEQTDWTTVTGFRLSL